MRAQSGNCPTLNIIGCGRVGRTLARIWLQHGLVRIGDVLNRSLQSGREATAFLGAGRAVEDYSQLGPAEWLMISTSDEAIQACAAAWVLACPEPAGVVVFHCSGALGAEILQVAQSQGAQIASLHPVKSFVDPGLAVATFPGTWCALEGDAEACAVLRSVLEACGANVFMISPSQKPLYHTGTVFACNYLVALVEVALECLERAGVDRSIGTRLLVPIVQETLSNVFRLGPVQAMTGPIVRGEVSVVAREIQSIDAWNPEYGQLYRALGQVAWRLAQSAGQSTPEALQQIRSLLETVSPY